MRIAFLIDRLGLDGISRVCLTQSKGLASRGVEVAIFTKKVSSHILKSLDNINIFRVYNEGYNVRNTLRSLSEYDIVHSHYITLSTLGSLISLTGIPHIFHEHGHFFPYFPRSFKSFVGFTRYILFESPNIILSKRIIAISNFVDREIRRIFPFTNVQKIRVVYNPIDSGIFGPVKTEKARELLGLDGFQHIILSIQSPGRQNDYEYIQIVKTILSKQKNTAIIIITRNRYSYDYIKEKLRNLTSVMIYNNIPSDRHLNLLYNASDVYFTISRWESFGYTIAEAMFVGKPVIGYDITAIGELIVNGFNGFKVPIGRWDLLTNAILTLLNDEEIRKQFGKNAREFAVESFSLDVITQRLLAIYKEVVESK